MDSKVKVTKDIFKNAFFELIWITTIRDSASQTSTYAEETNLMKLRL